MVSEQISQFRLPEETAHSPEQKELIKGLPVGLLTEKLSLIPDGVKLFDSVSDVRDRLVDIPEWYEDIKDTKELIRNLPYRCFSNFTKDEICRLNFSDIMMWNFDFNKTVEQDPFFSLMEKIKLSLWHNEGVVQEKSWNVIVRVYESIKDFSAGKDTQTSFDYAVGTNDFGYSQYARIFLDSELGLLIHHKGVHSLTIGFSVGLNLDIYLAQVQSPIKKGNRYLYSLGQNQVDGAIKLMQKNFKGFEIYIIDSDSLVEHLRSASQDDPNHIIPVEYIKRTYGEVLNMCDDTEKRIGKMKYHHIKSGYGHG